MAHRKVALSLLAHPDDAEFLCAGTLLRLRDAGWETHVATMTPGDCGTLEATPWEISAIRTREALAAARILGASYHCLDERDLFVCYDRPTVQKALDLFRRVTPTLVFTHAPKDYMMDHEMTAAIARAASFGYAAPNASRVALHPSARVPHLYYCDPVEGVDPHGQTVLPTTYVEVSKQLAKKVKALAAHQSQRDWLRGHHGMDEYVDSMKRHATSRGAEIGVPAAEAFIQHRGHAYPNADLLASLFGA